MVERGGGGVEWEVIGDRATGYRMFFSLSTFLLPMSNISLSETSRCDECLQLFCGSWKLNGNMAVCVGFGPRRAFSSTAPGSNQTSQKEMVKQKRDNIGLVQPETQVLLCRSQGKSVILFGCGNAGVSQLLSPVK